MNGCEHAVEYVYQYLDEELTVTRRARISIHLRRCGDCCNAFDFEKQLKAKIAAGGKSEPPPELFDHLRALLHQEQTNEDSGS
jgi:mycothiol system anti-sigma-R factor